MKKISTVLISTIIASFFSTMTLAKEELKTGYLIGYTNGFCGEILLTLDKKDTISMVNLKALNGKNIKLYDSNRNFIGVAKLDTSKILVEGEVGKSVTIYKIKMDKALKKKYDEQFKSTERNVLVYMGDYKQVNYEQAVDLENDQKIKVIHEKILELAKNKLLKKIALDTPVNAESFMENNFKVLDLNKDKKPFYWGEYMLDSFELSILFDYDLKPVWSFSSSINSQKDTFSSYKMKDALDINGDGKGELILSHYNHQTNLEGVNLLTLDKNNKVFINNADKILKNYLDEYIKNPPEENFCY